MPIDNTVQFNGHNSYRVTETIWCEPFGVQGMAYITHSFNAYATSALAAATRARTRFFAADGSILGTSDHSFAVTQVFAEIDLTLAVPANAVLCQVSFITSGTWWVAEPKSEEGQSATPYNTNYAGQMSLITPNGAYLGMLTTNQIVVSGSLADPTESLYARLITINNNAITLTNEVTGKTTNITAEGVYTGSVVADQITTGTLDAARIGAGTITAAKIAAGTITATEIAAATITAAKIAAGTITATEIAAATITAAKIAAGTITATQIAANTITAASGVIHDINASVITAGILKSVGNESSIDLSNGHFSFANGRLTYNGSALEIDGTLTTALGSYAYAKLQSGSLAFYNSSDVSKGSLAVNSAGDIYLYSASGKLLLGASTQVTCGGITCTNLISASSGAYSLGSSLNFWDTAYLNRIYGNGGAIDIQGHVLPTTGGIYNLGSSSYKWAAVWATNGTIQTSARNSKHDIGDILTTTDRKRLKGLKKQYKKNVYQDETGHAISGTTHEDLQGLLDRVADKLVTFTYDGPEGTQQLGIIADDFADDPEFGHIGETYTDEAGNTTYGLKPLSVTMLAIAGYRNLRERLNTIEAKQREGRT